MTAPQTDAITDPQGTSAALQQRLDAALSEKAALAEELATRDAALAQRNSEFGERIEHQAATIDVLKAMSASPADPQPVFDLIARQAAKLCNVPTAAVATFDGTMIHLATQSGFDAAYADAYVSQFPRPVGLDSSMGRAILHRRVDWVEDIATDPGHSFAGVLGHWSVMAVPILRDDVPLGAITIGRPAMGPFSDIQLTLLRTFAEQAVIAIGSAETYRALQARTADLQQSLEYQTATSDVLKVISRSTFDLQPVLDTLVETAARLCDADMAVFARHEGELFRGLAYFGYPPEYREWAKSLKAVSPNWGTVGHRAVLEGRVVHVHDVAADPNYPAEPITLGKQRTSLGVPLLREGKAIGVIVLARQRVEPFTDRQVALVSTFADQAVIAIENTRLLTEQQEALERQTSTAEVLQVINASPGDLTPVFDAMLEKAMRLCGAASGALHTYDGERFQAVALRGIPAAFAMIRRDRPLPTDPDSRPGQMLVTGRPVQLVDAMTDPYFVAHPNLRDEQVDLGGTRSSLNIPLLKDGTVVGAFVIYRKEPGVWPDKQVALLENFAAQAVIAMENARLLGELRQRTADLQESLEYQTATSDVLKVISRSTFDLQPVLDTLVETAARLCDADLAVINDRDGDDYHAVATFSTSPEFKGFFRGRVLPLDRGSITGRTVFEGRIVHIDDVTLDADYVLSQSITLGGARTMLGVPLLRGGVAAGVIALARKRVEPFTNRQIELVSTFAAQAVIAMENARLLTDTREALEQQTATAEVLQVINASPGNLAPVFDAILERALRLCGASFGTLATYDGERIERVAFLGVPPAFIEYNQRNPLTKDAALIAQGIATGTPVQATDIMTDSRMATSPGVRDALVELGRVRALLQVPLLKDGTVVGFIGVWRREPGVFPKEQIALLEGFAAQAVIAMENARLLTEQQEALEQQTATAEVLQVINASPGNLQPVFEAILDKAHTICGAAIGSLFVYDGEFLRAMATHGWPEQFDALMREPRRPTPLLQNLINGDRLFHIPDLRAMGEQIPRETTRFLIDVVGVRTFLALPLRRDRTLLGTITAHRLEVRPFSEKEIALLESFAAQAVIAMENARLLDEIRQRQEELRVTFENMGDGVAMFDETQHLVAWNRKFQDILDVPDDIIARRQTFSEYVHYLAERGEYDPEADPEEHVRWLIEQAGQPRTFERTRPDGRVIEIRHNPVPAGGFVLIYADITERKRSEAEIRAARDAAEEASRTIEAAYRDLKTAQANLIQAEKMASLGQLTAGIAHEIKNPLNFVNNFAELSVDLLGELKDAIAPAEAALNPDQRDEVDAVVTTLASNLEKITEHGKRADSIVKAMLEHSRGSSPERRMVDLNALIDEALTLAYHGARAQDQSFNITLERELGAGIAPIEVNPQDMTRVFLNIFSNGFYAATRRARSGGDATFVPTLKVTTRDAGEVVEIRVRDNGTGCPADIRDKLFQPFFTTKPTGEGTGLGLSITYDIVTKQHGGTIRVDSEVDAFAEFVVILPRQMFTNGGSRA